MLLMDSRHWAEASHRGERGATSDSQASVNAGIQVGNRKGALHTHAQVGETMATHVYCLWLQEVIHLMIWTNFGCVLEKGKGMGTDRGVRGVGRVRGVGLIRWEGIEGRLGRRITEQLGEMGASVREVDLRGLKVTVEV